MAYPPSQPLPPYGQPPVAAPPPSVAPARTSSPLLALGSIVRIIGVVLAGVALIWLGVWIMDPTAILGGVSTNPLAPFQAIGSIIILAAIGAILTGVGWSLQTWGVGHVLAFDRGH